MIEENNLLNIRASKLEFEAERREIRCQEKLKEYEKKNKDLSFMVKLCEEEKHQNKQLNNYELELKETKMKMIIEDMESNFQKRLQSLKSTHLQEIALLKAKLQKKQ